MPVSAADGPLASAAGTVSSAASSPQAGLPPADGHGPGKRATGGHR